MAKIGRNDLCPCGSGKKYKHCCLNNKLNIYDEIAAVVAGEGYDVSVSEVLCNLLRYMKEKQWIGACHATASVLYIVLSEMGLKPTLCVGEVDAQTYGFDHSWITVDNKIIDLACYMTLMGGAPASNPVIFDKDVVSKQKPNLTYGIQTVSGLDMETKMVIARPFGEYMQGFPDAKDGLWTIVKLLLPEVDIALIKEKYKSVERTVVKN